MSQILIIENALDQNESYLIESECPLKTFLNIRTKHPQARIYLGNPSSESDVTPTQTDKSSIERLIQSSESYTVVCYPGDVISAVTSLFVKGVQSVVGMLVPMPSMGGGTPDSTGSSNNNLANVENKQRIKQRVPYIFGRQKGVPDLFAPPYRHFENGIEVEELFLCLCENEVQVSEVKEGDTAVEEIPGKSVTIYGPGHSVVGNQNIYKLGDDFLEPPIIAKQSESINGQTLIPPNGTRIEGQLYFQYPNMIKTYNNSIANQFESFVSGENIIVEGANFGIADLFVTGAVEIDPVNNTLLLNSTQTITNYSDFRRINITAMLVLDPLNGQLDLAGLYAISNISYSSGVYTISLENPENTNAQFSSLSTSANTTLSGNFTANSANIYLDGTYLVSSIDKNNKTITLASPSSANPDWNKLAGLTGQITSVVNAKLRGSQSNSIGWYTINFKDAEGLLLNFRALNGIYQGNSAKTVNIEAEYQQMTGSTPVGPIYTQTITLTGRKNNRDSVGGSMWINLPFSGAVRFRARRTNDNGDAGDLMDETKFYQAYAFKKSTKLIHPDRVLWRVKTVVTPGATGQQTRKLNCIAESLNYTYVSGVKSTSKVPTRNIADLTIAAALHPKIGRRTIYELDLPKLYQTVNEITEYFGSSQLSEFNYTLDKTNTSFEELTRLMAFATCSHERRVARKVYYELEKKDNAPIILFNHRNKKPGSETVARNFRVHNHYDGIELTYMDSENGWIEKTLKVPHDAITNAKKIDTMGIIYTKQAHVIAWREWNKLKFKRISTKFTAYAESELVFNGNCILNTDDTRIDKFSDGYLVDWQGLDIRVSQPYLIQDSTPHVIHLQLKSDRQIDAIPITQGIDEYSFRLQRPPLEDLVTTGQLPTLYTITTDSEKEEQRFIVTKKAPLDIFENELSADIYDDRYYRNDKDIVNNLV